MWDESLTMFVEQGCPSITGAQWSICPLPAQLQERLLQLATDKDEPVDAVVADICEYLSDSDYAEFPLAVGLQFFLENELI